MSEETVQNNVAKVADNIQSKSMPEKPYKDMEYQEFLNIIGEGNADNWSIIAESLGVDRNTILRWKRTPAARQAIRKAIAESIANMEKYGKEDWKMHREKLKMLGINDKQSLEVEVSGNVEVKKLESIVDDILKEEQTDSTQQ